MKYNFEIGQIYIAQNNHEMEVVKLSPTGAYLIYHYAKKKLDDSEDLSLVHINNEGVNTGGNNFWDIKHLKRDPREYVTYTCEEEIKDLEADSYMRVFQTEEMAKSVFCKNTKCIKFKITEIIDE